MINSTLLGAVDVFTPHLVNMSEDVSDNVSCNKPEKRSRPDKAAAMAERRITVEKVVKSGLRKRLLEPRLLQPLIRRGLAISQSQHRGGLIFCDIVMRHVSERSGGSSTSVQFPPIFDEKLSQTFFRNCLTGGSSEPRVVKSLETTFRDYPSPERFAGDYQLYSSAALLFQTNVRNLVTEAFGPRQARFVKSWCRKDPTRRGKWFPIVKRINGWGVQEDISREAESFVAVEKFLLGSPGEVTTAWLKRNADKVFEAYSRWLTALEVDGEKRFALTPQFGVRMHNIKIDTDALYGVMKAEGLYSGNIKQFRVDAAVQWSSTFKTTGLATNQWTFSRMVETDGIACSIHFKRHKTEKEVFESERKKRDMAARKQATLERKAARDKSPERMKKELSERRKAATAEKQRKRSEGPPPPPPSPGGCEWKPLTLPEGTLAEDPGVSPNVTYTVHRVDGKNKRRRFTVGRYYTEGGVKRLQARTSTWILGVRSEQDYLSAEHLSTSSWDTLKEHVQRFGEVHGALWGEKTKSRWARGRFDTYIRKPKAVDAFYSEVRGDGPVKSHFFGNGSFRPTFRGCVPAPKTLVARRSKMAFPDTPFELVDEFCTTQCCWRCHARTQSVKKKSTDGQGRAVRGLVFCDSRTCGAFTNRDFQGAFNIGVCGHGPRPPPLARQTATGMRRTDAAVTPQLMHARG